MRLDHNKFKALRVLAIAIMSTIAAALILNVSFRSWDMFFLDWRQILLNSAQPQNSIVILDVSGLKRGDPTPRLLQEDLLKLTTKISERDPQNIIWAFSPGEIESETDLLSKKLEGFSRLFLYFDSSRRDGFYYHKNYSTFPRHLAFLLPHDTALDGVTRRIMLFYDTAKTNINDDFTTISKDLRYSIVDPGKVDGYFVYADSLQVYMKIWSREKQDIIHIKSMGDIESIAKDLKGKTVIVATFDTFGVMGSPSINYRKDLANVTIENGFTTDAETIKNYLINLSAREYIKVPSLSVNIIWLSAWYFLVLASLIFLRRFNGIAMSFVWLALFPIIGAIAYKTWSVNLDFTRGILGSLLFQYFGIPVLLIRVLRKTDAEKLEMEKSQERERVKTRFVVKAAKADLSIQMAARVSHDIRSPLMALQIASSVIKGKVSDDLENLISESTARLKFIADDILQKYREGKSTDQSVERSNLENLVEELLSSYRFLYPKIDFQIDLKKDIYIFIPQYSLQRALSNLLNNSVEALKDQSPAVIRVTTELRNNVCVISVNDNGPGVSTEIRARLFQEKATHGKAGGTGLGLYQVRKELEIYGGTVTYVDGNRGSCFEVSLPLDLERIDFTVSSRLLILESADQISSLLSSDLDQGITIHRCKSVAEAIALLRDQQSKEWTVLADLVLSSDEESGFDLIEKISREHAGKIVLCTSLFDNKEIQEMAHKYNTVLISHQFLARLRLRT